MDSNTIIQELQDILDWCRLHSSDLGGRIVQHAHGGAHEVSKSKTLALKDIMEAVTDPNIYVMGLCGKDKEMADVLEIVHRRVTRDKLFGAAVVINITKKPNLERIQHEIADELGLKLEENGKEGKSAVVSENSRQLYERIMKEPKILIILLDLQEKIDLEKVGIPFGAAHPGCKVILTSESKQVLSNKMNDQRTIKIHRRILVH